MDSKDTLMYWITERERIRIKKELGMPKPWSVDPVFQQTYFCNVRREDDRVTRWIRQTYNSHVADPMFEFNIILARFLNWPATLAEVGYFGAYNKELAFELEAQLNELALEGKIWGNAYVVTTHGIPMSKVAYLCHNVLMGVMTQYEGIRAYISRGPVQGYRGTLSQVHGALMQLEGLGNFMAGQVVADLKNTPNHPLMLASDWLTFVAEGPGSKRGVNWFHRNDPAAKSYKGFMYEFMDIRDFVDEHWSPTDNGPTICNQDLQNCLCEYDKYLRVREGTGTSKRNYNGG